MVKDSYRALFLMSRSFDFRNFRRLELRRARSRPPVKFTPGFWRHGDSACLNLSESCSQGLDCDGMLEQIPNFRQNGFWLVFMLFSLVCFTRCLNSPYFFLESCSATRIWCIPAIVRSGMCFFLVSGRTGKPSQLWLIASRDSRVPATAQVMIHLDHHRTKPVWWNYRARALIQFLGSIKMRNSLNTTKLCFILFPNVSDSFNLSTQTWKPRAQV